LYDRFDDARNVAADLEAAGILRDEISMVSRPDESGRTGSGIAPAHAATETTHSGTAGGAGAAAGTAIGGGLGLAAGLGALAIPGVGPVVAAGWLIATLAGAGVGAMAGGLVGALTGAGIGKEEANVYAEGVRGGGTLVTVRVDEADAARVEAIMGRHAPADWRQRRAAYGDAWTGFDETRVVAADPVDEVVTRRPIDERVTGIPDPGRPSTRRP